MPRKQRIDSHSAAVEVMKKAAQELFPPDHVEMTEADSPYWINILAEKAKSEWTAHDLELAALLARSLRMMQEQEVKLEKEDFVITTAGGNLAQNPRVRIVSDLHGRIIKYRQTLGIHSRGKNGDARDVAKRRGIARGIEADSPLDDDLLGMPN